MTDSLIEANRRARMESFRRKRHSVTPSPRSTSRRRRPDRCGERAGTVGGSGMRTDLVTRAEQIPAGRQYRAVLADAHKPPPRRLRNWKWTPIHRGGLPGFASVELSCGLRLPDLPVCATGRNGPWVGLSRRPRLDSQRRQRLDINREPEFESVVYWLNRATAGQFSRTVLRILLGQHPGGCRTQPVERFGIPRA